MEAIFVIAFQLQLFTTNTTREENLMWISLEEMLSTRCSERKTRVNTIFRCTRFFRGTMVGARGRRWSSSGKLIEQGEKLFVGGTLKDLREMFELVTLRGDFCWIFLGRRGTRVNLVGAQRNGLDEMEWVEINDALRCLFTVTFADGLNRLNSRGKNIHQPSWTLTSFEAFLSFIQTLLQQILHRHLYSVRILSNLSRFYLPATIHCCSANELSHCIDDTTRHALFIHWENGKRCFNAFGGEDPFDRE